MREKNESKANAQGAGGWGDLSYSPVIRQAQFPQQAQLIQQV